MKTNHLIEITGKTDIYLLDQILKLRYNFSEKILDVGCGHGRNIHWFYQNGFDIHGVDKNKDRIQEVKRKYPNIAENFIVSNAEELPFNNSTFNHIICNAVLHFAESKFHFENMFSELIRVLKIKGTLFIRMTSNIGIKDKVILISEGVYKLPDTTSRFLLTKPMILNLMEQHNLSFLEPLKTVNVNDLRCMTTMVIQRK